MNNLYFVIGSESFSQSVGIGSTQFAPKNTLDVAGGVAIGTGYAGSSTAPSNGLIVQGFIGAATNSAYCPLTISYTSSGSPGISNDVGFQPGTLGTSHEALFNVSYAQYNDPNGQYMGVFNLVEPGLGNNYGKLIGTYNWLHGGIAASTTAGSYGSYNNITCGFGETVDTLFGTYNLMLQGSGVSTPNATFGNYTKVGLSESFANPFGNVYGDYVTAQSGTPVSTIYGLYVDDLASKVTGSAYGVYCAGNQLNYFGGNTGIGTIIPAFKLDVNGNTNVSTNNGYWIGGSEVLWINGAENLFCGVSAAPSNTGAANTFVGSYAGSDNTTGSENTCVGEFSGPVNQNGSENVSVGCLAGYSQNGGS